jgi:hypothetical protein
VGMFDPKFILSKYVFTAKLASFPVESFLILADISPNVFVALFKLKRYLALLARRKHVGVLALIQQMMGKLSNIDISVTFLTEDKYLAIAYIMFALILEILRAIRALTLLLEREVLVNFYLFLASGCNPTWVNRFFENRLFAI